MHKSYSQHIETLNTLAWMLGHSSDLNLRSKMASLEWLAKEFTELQKERDRLAEDLSIAPQTQFQP